jgi:dolichyl-phosphooligosaccharide-protein glycotransferase
MAMDTGIWMCVVAGGRIMINLDFLKNKQNQFIIATIVILSLLSLWVRILPMFNVGNADILTFVASDDPLYNFRQVEQILANFPNYAWYDPMSLFPVGSDIYWGSMFTTIVAIACMITGATTRPEIIATGLLIPPIMSMVMVPIMYYIGKICGDWKTGLLSAFFIAVVSGQYFFRSFYGYMDHHMAEVLFSTIFCLLYMYTLYSEKDTKIILNDPKTYKKTIFLSVLTGLAYIVGLLVMPTMMLFAMIVGIFTVIQFFIDGFREKSSEYLVVINTTLFATATIGLLIFGLKSPGISLSTYSIGHIYAYAGLIIGTIGLYAIRQYFGKDNFVKAILTVIGVTIAFIVALAIFFPQLYQLFIVSFFTFFGQEAVTETVQEAKAWGTALAWSTFNYGLVLMFGGVLVMLYKNIKDEHPYHIFGLIWSLIVLYSTWQHVRYEYYLAVPLCVLAAVCVSYILDLGLPDLKKFAEKLSNSDKKEIVPVKEKPKNKKQRLATKRNVATNNLDHVMSLLVIVAFGISALFAFTSFSMNYTNAASTASIRMNPDWKETMDWMNKNTPDPGLNYTQVYDKSTFQYPKEAYGVMSWWDYGHMITFIAKRIPNANPFQQGVVGMNGSANFFMAQSEYDGNKVLTSAGTRYVVTDIEMDTGKFWAMSTWYNTTEGVEPYQSMMLTPNENQMVNSYQQVQVNHPAYFNTMISRLHNFDGTLVAPQTTYYIEYIDPIVSQVSLPVITSATLVNVSDSDRMVNDYNQKAPAGYHAALVSPIMIAPTGKVPALQHYRLVHESPSNVFTQNNVDLKYVKVFEYVKGAHIKGDGIIEIRLISNTGRKFTYQQESSNGEFIVPYSTTGNPYGVKAEGRYLNLKTGAEYDVPESAVMSGDTIV